MSELNISVVIPVYNREDTISRAIDSVINQTIDNFEIVVVDDGSTDNTLEIIRSYEDDRIKIIKNSTNKGANAARNVGIRNATGDIISFLDSDDRYAENNLEVKRKKIRQLDDQYAGIVTPIRKFRGGKIFKLENMGERDIHLDNVRTGNNVGGFSAVAIRKQVFNRVGFLCEALPSSQDIEFYMRLLKKFKLKQITGTYVDRYLIEDRITTSIDNKMRSIDILSSKHEELISPAYRSGYLTSVGVLAGKKGDLRLSRRLFYKAYKHNRSNAKSLVLSVISMFGPRIFNIFIRTFYDIRSAYYRRLLKRAATE